MRPKEPAPAYKYFFLAAEHLTWYITSNRPAKGQCGCRIIPHTRRPLGFTCSAGGGRITKPYFCYISPFGSSFLIRDLTHGPLLPLVSRMFIAGATHLSALVVRILLSITESVSHREVKADKVEMLLCDLRPFSSGSAEDRFRA